MKTIRLTTLALLLATAASLQAESFRYGVQGLVNIPTNDLSNFVDSKPGPGIGLHCTFDMWDGHMLRPRLDYSAWPEVTLTNIKQNASSLSLGGDYLFFFAGKPERLYVTVGASAIRWSLEQQDTLSDTSRNTTKLGISAGVGYQWNATIGTELRWVHSSVSKSFQADSLQGGVTFRF